MNNNQVAFFWERSCFQYVARERAQKTKRKPYAVHELQRKTPKRHRHERYVHGYRWVSHVLISLPAATYQKQQTMESRSWVLLQIHGHFSSIENERHSVSDACDRKDM